MADNKKTEELKNEETKKQEAKSEPEAEEAKSEDKPEGEAEAKEAAPKADEKKPEAKAEDKAEKMAEDKEPKEEKKADKPKAEVKVSAKLEKIIKEVEGLSVLELADLVKALEDKFGVSATAMPVAAAANGAGGAAGGGDEGPKEEQTTFNVILAEAGANKISVIKAVREVVPSLGLKDAKDLVEAAPKPVLEGANKETANEAKGKLEAAGAKVELK
jgi:large subunit ribosomal protein L7/L12